MKGKRMERFYYKVLIQGVRFFWLFLLAGIILGTALLLGTKVDGVSLLTKIWQG